MRTPNDPNLFFNQDRINRRRKARRRSNFLGVLGVLTIILGIVLGLYLGVVVCFIGGIIQFIHGVQGSPVDATDIAWGVARVLLASLVGWATFAILSVIGVALLDD